MNVLKLLSSCFPLLSLALIPGLPAQETTSAELFGEKFPALDNAATGEWWNRKAKEEFLNLDVPRDEVVAFAVYTTDHGVLKLTAQFYPLKSGETKQARLEIKEHDQWQEIAKAPILYPGWSAHFRLDNWDDTRTVAYRVRHGDSASFEGSIRRDPKEKKEIIVASLSCNSGRTHGPRAEIIDNLRQLDPDLLFFAGDQSYHHTQHTAAWLQFGRQFRDIMRDRPTITIPDDHDIGQANLWGESGKLASSEAGPDGGYFYPPAYVNMVERQQTWHLPDPADPAPVQRGIGVYFTRMRLGGLDFAILEDRKFKSGPQGKIPGMGPRPDHINDPAYERDSIDLPGLELLGERQIRFLNEWGADWNGAEIKVVLSQTAFCGAVHMHGSKDRRLLADLDCNGWPQTGRNKALELIRRVRAVHLCGDQHLGVVVKHGIDEQGDGPYGFTNPAIVNTIYGRWWHPADEKAGLNPISGSPLPWTGDYEDGLGNKIHMMAYANPGDVEDEKQRGDGFGVARFSKTNGTVTFECWPRFSKVADGDKAQFPGWPITVNLADNDGRKAVAQLPTLDFGDVKHPVVEVISDATGESLFVTRITGSTFQPKVFAPGKYTIKAGLDKPDIITKNAVEATAGSNGETLSLRISQP